MRELPFHLGGQTVRVTYWTASGRRIVLLMVFGKTRMRQTWRLTGWTMTARSAGDVRLAGAMQPTDDRAGAADAYDAARLAYELGRRVRSCACGRD